MSALRNHLALVSGMGVAVYTPKGKKFRGRAVIKAIEGKTIKFEEPLRFKIRRGDTLMLGQEERRLRYDTQEHKRVSIPNAGASTEPSRTTASGLYASPERQGR